MFNIRVGKYNPKFRDKTGKFIGSDWTSISDIDGKIFSMDEYLNIENKYVVYVENIVKNNEIKNLIITEFEDVLKNVLNISTTRKKIRNNTCLGCLI